MDVPSPNAELRSARAALAEVDRLAAELKMAAELATAELAIASARIAAAWIATRSTVEKDELSEREARVVRLIAAGHSNKEVAARLGLSVKTVETYKARSLRKLGLRSRAELVRYALRCGWLRDG